MQFEQFSNNLTGYEIWTTIDNIDDKKKLNPEVFFEFWSFLWYRFVILKKFKFRVSRVDKYARLKIRQSAVVHNINNVGLYH